MRESKVEIQYPVKEKIEPVEIQDSKTKDALVKQKELSQRRYLQMLIKRMAEARGCKATIEELTPDGQGRVDVPLTQGEKRMACEIGITTTKEWETHNVVTCLQTLP